MPVYMERCLDPECGIEQETYWKLADIEEHGHRCEECGGPASNVLFPTVQSGPTDTHPFRVDQIGKTFTTKSQLREYEGKHGVFHDPKDKEWRDHYDHVRNLAEDRSKEAGFRDLNHRREYTKKEAEKKRAVGDSTPVPHVG
jgi:hypothetical protein